MGDIIIGVRDLVKTYAGTVPVHALQGVSFEIHRGEFVGLMGRSGSGKSTLLHMLGLLDEPTSGKIEVAGQDVSTFSAHQRTHARLERIGYIFQEFALLNEFSALQNVAIPMIARGVLSRPAVYTRAEKLFREVGLGARLRHFPNQLSGGEQQRVAVARALANEPDILLADEPSANLDSDSAEAVMQVLSDLNRRGQTVFMISHEEDDVRWTNRVIRLRDGRIERIEEMDNQNAGKKKSAGS